jgi:REP element-mobilizing transposase RayT
MPNHVHALIELSPGFPLDGIVHSWKSFTAKEANRELRRTGEFWMADYFDRYMRSDNHLHNTIAYIEDNPPVAGLVASREDWPWSSASHTWTKPG